MKLTVGEKIALLRKEKNITQTELAEYLVLAPQTISRWEVGNGAPEISLLPPSASVYVMPKGAYCSKSSAKLVPGSASLPPSKTKAVCMIG